MQHAACDPLFTFPLVNPQQKWEQSFGLVLEGQVLLSEVKVQDPCHVFPLLHQNLDNTLNLLHLSSKTLKKCLKTATYIFYM